MCTGRSKCTIVKVIKVKNKRTHVNKIKCNVNKMKLKCTFVNITKIDYIENYKRKQTILSINSKHQTNLYLNVFKTLGLKVLSRVQFRNDFN